jgi:fatty acid CoA ligase FadD9
MTKGSPYSRPLLNSVEDSRKSKADLHQAADVVADAQRRQALDVDPQIKTSGATRGQYDAVANLESIYATAELVRHVRLCSRIGLRSSSVRPAMLAIVVPTSLALAEYGNTPTLKKILYQSLTQVAAMVGLQPCEVPIKVLVQTEPFTDENGLLAEGPRPRHCFEERPD